MASFNDFVRRYNEIAAINGGQQIGGGSVGGQAPQQEPMTQLPQFTGNNQYQIENALQRSQADLSTLQEQTEPRYRQMSDLEKGLTGIRQAGEGLLQGANEMFGFNPEKGFTFENVLRMAPTLPAQMLSGLTEGLSQGYEFVGGKNILEGADIESGTVMDYDLDTNQRAASGLNALINVGGLLTGGSGRVIGTVGKLGTGGKAFGRMARGSFASEAATGVGKFAGQTAYDVAEEASEEFVQAYLDDARYKINDGKTFERAIESAKWGAAGGGMMSGAMQGINAAYDYYKGNSTNTPNTQQGVSGSSNLQAQAADFAELRPGKGNLEGYDLTKVWLKEDFTSRGRGQAGSDNATNVKTDVGLDLDDAYVGDEHIVAMYRRSAEDQIEVENWLGINKETASAALLPDKNGKYNAMGIQFDTPAGALEALRENRKLKFAIGRNPDTKNGGFFANVVGFHHGKGLTVHPAVMSMVGADFDADKSGIYLNTSKINVNGYAHDMLVSNEGGRSNIDYDLMFSTDLTADRAKDVMQKVLTPYGDEIASKYSTMIYDAFTAKDGKYSKDDISITLNEMKNELESTVGTDQAVYALNQFLKPITGQNSVGIERAIEFEAKKLNNAIEEMEEVDGEFIERLGSQPAGARVTQFYRALGLIAYQLTGKGNAIFRQYAQLYYAAQNKVAFKDAVQQYTKDFSEDSLETIIRASLRMEAQGISPSSTIEGMVDAAIIAETIQAVGYDFKIKNGADVKTLLAAFMDAYNKYAKIFNKAQDKLSTKYGYDFSGDQRYKNEIESIDDAQAMRSFTKIFGNILMEDIFNKNLLPGYMQGYSLNQVLEDLANDKMRPRLEMVQYDGVQSFFNRLVGNFDTEKQSLSNRFKNMITEYDLGESLEHYLETGELNPYERYIVAAYFDGINMIITPEIGLGFGLDNADKIKTQTGKMLLSNNPDERLRAIVSISMREQFRPIVEAINSGDRDLMQRATYQAEAMVGISPIHAKIIQQLFSESHSSELLNVMTDLNITWDRLEVQVNNMLGQTTYDLFLDSIRTESSDFDLSGLSDRYRKAESSITRSVKRMYRSELAEVGKLRNLVNNSDGSALVQWFNDVVHNARVQQNTDVLGAQLWASFLPSHDAVEKATIQEAAALAAMQNQLANNGRQLSFMDSMLSEPFGEVRADVFNASPYYMLNLFADPELYYRVTDPVSGTDVIVTRDVIFKSVSDGYDPEIGPRPDDIFALLEKHPQLSTWLCRQQPQLIQGSGAPSATLGRVETLTDSYTGFVQSNTSQEGKDPKFDAGLNDAKLRVENILLTTPGYKEYLVRISADEIKGGLHTPEDAVKIMGKAHRKALNGFFVAAVNGMKTPAKTLEGFRTSTRAQLISDTRSLVDAAITNMEILTADNQSVFYQAFKSQVANSWAVDAVRGFFPDLDLDNVDTSDETMNKFIDSVDGVLTESIDVSTKLLAIFTYLYQTNISDMSMFVPSRMTMDAITEAVNRHNNNPSNKNNKISLDEVQDVIDENININIDSLMDNSTLPSLFDLNKIITDKNEFEKLVKDIADESGKVVDQGEIDSDWDLYSGDKEGDRKNVIYKWNGIAIESIVNQANSSIGATLNGNMLGSMDRTFGFAENLLETIRRDADLPRQSRIDMQAEIPIPSFIDGEIELIANNMRLMDDGGYGEMAVSLNGSMAKHLSGLGFLPEYILPDVPARPTTVGEILSEAQDINAQNLRWHFSFVEPNKNMSSNDLRVIGACINEMSGMDPNTQVWVFDPKYSPHGLDSAFVPASRSDGPRQYHRLGRILLDINSYAQEGMVLKAKKVLGNAKSQLHDIHKIFSRSGTVKNAGAANQGILSDALIEYRDEMANFFNEEFSKDGRLEALGYGKEEALILAQGCTPGIELRLSDGTRRILDASAIFGTEQSFMSAMESITNSGNLSIVDAEIYVVSPVTLSYRILGAVSQKMHSDPSASKNTIRKVAQRAANNWSNMKVGALDVNELLGGCAHIGRTGNFGINVEGSRTAVQYFLSRELDLDSGVARKDVYSPANFITEQGERDWNSIASIVRGKGLPDNTVRVFYDDQKKAISASEIARKDIYEQINSANYKFQYTPQHPCRAILIDGSLSDAISWSNDTNGIVFVPEDVFMNLDQGTRYRSYMRENFTYQNKKYYAMNFRAGRELNDFAAGRLEDKLKYLNYDDICATYVDTKKVFSLGDATIQMDPEAGKTFVQGFGVSNFSLPSLFRGGNDNRFSIANDIIIENLRADFQNDPDATIKKIDWSSQGKLSKEAQLVMLREFLDADVTIRNKQVRHGDIIAFAANGTRLAPIIAPKTAPENIDTIHVETRGTDAVIVYSGIGGIDPNSSKLEFAKGSLEDEAFKGIITVAEDTRLQPALMVGDERCRYVVSGETEASRAYGRDKQFLVDTLFYQSRKYNMSLLFDKKADGSYQWKEHILSQETATDDVLYKLLTNQKEAWRLVKGGQLNLGQTEETNRVIRKLVTLCDIFNGTYTSLFSAFVIDTDENGGAKRLNKSIYHHLYFDTLSDVELFQLFSEFTGEVVSDPLCLTVKNFDEMPDATPLVDKYGRTRVSVLGGEPEYGVVRWGVPRIIGEIGNMSVPSGHSNWAYQHVYNRGVENGYLDEEFEDAITYADFLLGSTEYLKQHTLKRPPDSWSPQESLDGSIFDNGRLGEIIQQNAGLSWSEIQEINLQNERATSISYVRPVRDKDGNIIDNPAEDPQIKEAIDRLNSELKFDRPLTYDQVAIEAARIAGFTYDKNGLSENNQVPYSQLISEINDMIRMAKTGNMVPIANEVHKGKTKGNRYALSMLSRDEINWWWQSAVIRNNFDNNQQLFIDAIKNESDMNVAQLQYLTGKDAGKKTALLRAYSYDYRANGYQSPTGRIHGNVYEQDVIEADTIFFDAWSAGEEKAGAIIDREAWDALSSRQRQMLRDLANHAIYKNNVRAQRVNMVNGQALLTIETQDGRTINQILDNATQLSKVLALINPGVMASNILDRAVHQGIMNAALHIGHTLHIGPYAGKVWLNQDVVTNAINQETAIKVYSAYRMAQFTGDEYEFLAGMSEKGTDEIQAWLDRRKENMTPYQRSVDRIYDIATGGNMFLKNQMRNFWNRLVMFIEQDPEQSAIWLREVGTDQNGRPITELERRLAENPTALFLELLGATRADSPSLDITMQAMNSAKQGDLAQRNILMMLFQYVTKDTPLSKFFVTTTVMRFPEYTLNVSGRMLNWLLPMSTINYVFTEQVAKWGAKQGQKDGKFDPHFEVAQVHTSLKEAMLVDITHLGVGAVSMILISMAGGIEPPEDKKKWGNPQEWICCGLRVGEAWWIEDILGIALPMACFAKSAQLGNPRFDLLFNGINQACYNNPIIKVSDAVGFLLEPEGTFVTDFEDDVIAYQKAKGGPPSYTDWLQSNAMNFGLSWASQFFTPSLVREWYNNAQQWEASYKKIYKETPTGKLSESGEDGNTEWTTYQDAMIRRATRRNPILGWLANIATGGNSTTGYMAHEMPDVIYRDDAQLAQMEKWSIDGLSDSEAQAKILEIITVMQQYDDMNELRATGFYLDSQTKAALSSVVWDTIQEFDDFYNGLAAEGKLDYYYLGNGDFTTGQMIGTQLKQSIDEQKRAWTNFYYDKVRSDALSQPLVSYKRYNTTYAQDDEGNFYATGLRPQGILPFISAPGRMGDPEGTAGYENDWVTISAVTGQPMEGKRALVPITEDGVDWPDLEYWAGNSDGTGHSDLYKRWYGTAGDGTLRGESAGGLSSLSDLELPEGLDLTRDPDDTNSRYPRYSRRYGGGSGGGGSSYPRSSGGSGGGGGGGFPNIYSHVNAPNISNPDTMRGARNYDANYDALRPNFTTKGSREAYKRSDI